MEKPGIQNHGREPHPHPALPYSVGLAPPNFWFFPEVELAVKGKHFESTQDIQEPPQCSYSHETRLGDLLQKLARTMGQMY